VSVLVDTFGTATVAEQKIERAVRKVFGLRPAQIVEQLKLMRAVYEPTSSYGHFGRTTDFDTFTWENTNKVAALCDAV